MTIVAFDTLAYANKLKNGGVESGAAEAQAGALQEIMHDFIKNQLSTKEDLRNIEITLSQDILKTESTLRVDILSFRNQVQEEMVALERRMYGFIVKTTIFTVTILGGLQTLFKFVH